MSEPEEMKNLIKVGRYVRPSFFVQLITEECHIETHYKYSTNHEKKHNEWASNRLKPEIAEKRRNIYRNDEKIKDLQTELKQIGCITPEITRNLNNKEEFSSFLKDEGVRLYAEIQHLREINKSLQEEINEMESKLF